MTQLFQPEPALWRFAIGVYGRPGVADACLALQDEAGLDVPFLLFLLWAERAAALTADRAAAAARASALWRDRAVGPLRALRRDLKAGAPELGPDLAAQVEAFRTEVKAAELSAEKLQLAALARLVASGLPSGSPSGLSDGDDPVDAWTALRAADPRGAAAPATQARFDAVRQAAQAVDPGTGKA